MAKIVTKVVVVKFSKIIKDNDPTSDFDLTEDVAKTLEEVAQEMCGKDIVVETEAIND